ncbi:MAG TPA: hypothetical protein VGG86_20580 [Roseiarcus sp.]
MLSVLSYDRGGRLQPNADPAELVVIGALGRNSPEDILGGQNRRHLPPPVTRRFAIDTIFVVKSFSVGAFNFPRVILEIDIWRAANLMLKRHGDKALEEWRGRLQANYRRRRSARQQRIARPGALIGTDP